MMATTDGNTRKDLMSPIGQAVNKPNDLRWRRLLVLSGVSMVAVLMAVALLLARQGASPSTYIGTVLNPPQHALDFNLRNQRGETFQLAGALDDKKIVVLTFLYTSCTDVCPFVGVKLRQTSDLLGKDADDVAFVAITVDPERDTPERIAEYSRQLGLYDRWHYLIGSEEQLKPIWNGYYVADPFITDRAVFASDSDLKFYGLLQGLDTESIAEANRARGKFGGGYDVSHPTPVWLIDSDQQIRVKLGQDLDPKELVQDIRLMVKSQN